LPSSCALKNRSLFTFFAIGINHEKDSRNHYPGIGLPNAHRHGFVNADDYKESGQRKEDDVEEFHGATTSKKSFIYGKITRGVLDPIIG
jgi:hypothetical protein